MANSYANTSTIYPVAEEDRPKVEALLNDLGKSWAAEYYRYTEEDSEDYEALEPEWDFCWEWVEEGLHLYVEDCGNVEHVIDAISELQVVLGATEPFVLSYAFTCDKTRPDEFGGGSAAISPTGEVFCVGTQQDALNEMNKGYGNIGWQPSDVQTLRDMTDVEAEDFLRRNKNRIRDRLVELGRDVLEALLVEEGR